MKWYFLAALLASAAPALADDTHSIYGIGTETCQAALTHDWLAQGEVAWIAGFMTSSSIATAEGDILPGHSTQDLVGIVYDQCKAHPFDTLDTAAVTIMLRLWDKQRPPSKGERF